MHQQRDAVVVFDPEPVVLNAPIHDAGDLVGSQVPKPPIIGQLIPALCERFLAARPLEDERYPRAPGLRHDGIGRHEHGVNLVLPRWLRRQDEGDGNRGAAVAGHRELSLSRLSNLNIPVPGSVVFLSCDTPDLDNHQFFNLPIGSIHPTTR